MTRPRRRWLRWIAGGLLALVAVVLLRVVVYRAVGARLLARERARAEAVFGPLDLESLREPPVADHENAVPAVRGAIAAMDLESEEANWPHIGDPSHLPVGLDRPALETRLAGRSADLDRLADAARIPEVRFGTFDGKPTIRANDLLRWLRAARLSRLDGVLALHGGDADRLERSLLTLHGLTSTLRRGPLLLHVLMGHAVEGLYLDLLRAAVASEPSFDQIARWRRQVDALQRLPGTKATLRGELGFAIATISADGTESTDRLDPVDWRGLLLPISEGHVKAELCKTYRTVLELAALRPEERAALEPVRRPPRWRYAIDPTLLTGIIEEMMASNLLAAVERRSLATSVERLAAIALDLIGSVHETGVYPQAVADLELDGGDPDFDLGVAPVYERRSDGGAELRLDASRRQQLELAGAGTDEVDASLPAGVAAWIRLCVWPLPPSAERGSGAS